MTSIHGIRSAIMPRAARRLSAIALLLASTFVSSACEEFLDVNTNPNAPEAVSPNLYLAPMMHWVATSELIDGLAIGRYAQEWTVPPATVGGAIGTFETHGYTPGSDTPAQLYRDVYWNFGNNLTDMITLSEEQERWDIAGVGYVLRAWGWLKLTSLHGELIVSQAFTPDQFRFDFDTQEDVYKEIFRLLDKGIELLKRTDGNLSASYLAVGDRMYSGNASRWLKFAYGLKAIGLNHFSNKSTYNAAAVIAAVDSSFVNATDDALFPYPNVNADVTTDRNYYGTSRGNLGSYRQTTFIVGLMNGTQYPGAVDPRISRMLAQDSTGTYRGIDPMVGYGSVTRERPWSLWGRYGTGLLPVGQSGRYLFDDRARMPVMTYSQLQFIKAEAALKRGDQATARQAYINGITAHIDFVNARNTEVANPEITQISAAERSAFLANPAIAPATITLSHILGQKFIAQWAWSHAELWMDLRRYHYTDMDPVSGTQVFRDWKMPLSTQFFVDNNGKPVQRIRPRYNSDYVWNREGLAKIGGLALDYHTKPMWITER